MRAISDFSLEAGTSTLGWRAWIAFRTRVSMSAMGSLVIKLLGKSEDRSPEDRRQQPVEEAVQVEETGCLGRRVVDGRRVGEENPRDHVLDHQRHTQASGHTIQDPAEHAGNQRGADPAEVLEVGPEA